MPRRESCLAAAAITLAAAAFAPTSGAVTLHAGDAIVADGRYPGPATDPDGGRGAIMRVPRSGGSRTVLASAGSMVEPMDVDLLRSGKLVVVDRGENGPVTSALNGKLLRINPLTGGQSILSVGRVYNPSAAVVAPGGDIFIADIGPTDGGDADGRIVRYDPRRGIPTVLASGHYLVNPRGIALTAGGALLVTDSGPTDRLIAIEHVSGAQSVVHTGPPLADPRGLAVDVDGTVLIADAAGSVMRFAPASNAFTQIVTGGLLSQPGALARELSGSFVVADLKAPLDRLGPGGSLSTLSQGTEGVNQPNGIASVEICDGRVATIVGTEGDDVLTGTRFPDVIVGGEGNDRLVGGFRKDRLCGGPGKDVLIGGRGRDTLLGGPGRDTQYQLGPH